MVSPVTLIFSLGNISNLNDVCLLLSPYQFTHPLSEFKQAPPYQFTHPLSEFKQAPPPPLFCIATEDAS